jgi:VanZ family protein
VLLAGYGAVSELVQELIGRDAAIGDWVADVLGLLLGLLMWQLVTRHRRA